MINDSIIIKEAHKGPGVIVLDIGRMWLLSGRKKQHDYEEGYQKLGEYVEGPPEKNRIKVTRKLRNRGDISHETYTTLALLIMNIYEYLISVNN